MHYNELDDAGAVLAVSAQLLRNLSTGLADPKLRDATEKMMLKFAPIGSTRKGPDWEQSDVFVWSILMALGELKRCG